MTNDPELFDKVLTLSNHDDYRTKHRPEMVGFKYKMSNIQAAIGCGQMIRINELVNRKREILRSYQDEFVKQGINHHGFNQEPEGCLIGAWMTTAIMDTPSANSRISETLQRELKKSGIDARPFLNH